MERLRIHYTCVECKSGNEVLAPKMVEESLPQTDLCHLCKHEHTLKFHKENEENILNQCVICERKDFFQQKDFNRKIGVALFVIAAILSFWTYGISLIVLYLVDLFLFSKIGNIVICYNCQTIYRGVKNIKSIAPFNHEMNDRIIYSGHDFKGQPLDH